MSDEIDIDALLKGGASSAAPAAAPSQGEIDIDALLKATPQNPAAAAKPGMLESIARGAADGATMGFAAKSGVMSREANKKARDENPVSYVIGNLVGSLPTLLIPGAAPVRGAGALANALKSVAVGSTTGAVSGVGHSDKGLDLNAAAMGAFAGGAAPAMVASKVVPGQLGLQGLRRIYTNPSANSGAMTRYMPAASVELGAFIPAMVE